MKRKLAILLLLALACAGGYWIWKTQFQKPVGELTLYGNVDIREVNLGFRVSGKVKEVLKDEGDPVKVGELVARLDPEPYQEELERAKAQAALSKAKLDLMEAGYRKEDIAQARANLEQQKATLANAERIFNRRKELLERKVASQQEYDDALANLEEARARVNSMSASLTLLETGYRPEEIAQARADYAAAQAAVATAQLHLEDTELKSSANGTVITRALEPGTVIQAGPTVLTVSLSEPVWVRAYVAEPDLGKVSPGTQATVFTDSQPNRPYHGQVGFVSPRAEFTPKSVETTDLRTALVYRLRVIVSDADLGLRQGMPVTVKIKTR